MRKFKKRFLLILLLFSLVLILCNYRAMVDFVSHRSYQTFSENELTGIFLSVEFIDGTELALEEEWETLIQKFPYFNGGSVHKAVLSDGRAVLAVSNSKMGKFVTNQEIRGIFEELPEEILYLEGEQNISPYVFFCFENYFSRTGTDSLKPNMGLFFLGIAGAFLSICGFLTLIFPQLLPALFQKNNPQNRGERDSNFELLRIVCMIMIIMQHFGFWGEFELPGDITADTVILQSIVNVGKIGVNCFMMITGYYCSFGTFRPSKITGLVLKVWFYTWGIAIILFSSGVGIRSVENIIKSTFPICSGAFWFVTTYLIVYVLSPYINMVIKNTEKEKYRILLIFLFIIWSVIPSVITPGWEFSNTGWMIYMYLLGGYFRKYPEVWEDCKVKPVLYFIGSYAFLMYLTFLWDDKVEMKVYHQGIAQKHTILIVICSVALFVFFKNIRLGHRKIINQMAASTFGVYLIHENPVVNDLLWTDWLKVNSYFGKPYFGLYAISFVLLVYVLCTIADMILGLGYHALRFFIKKMWHK